MRTRSWIATGAAAAIWAVGCGTTEINFATSSTASGGGNAATGSSNGGAGAGVVSSNGGAGMGGTAAGVELE